MLCIAMSFLFLQYWICSPRLHQSFHHFGVVYMAHETMNWASVASRNLVETIIRRLAADIRPKAAYDSGRSRTKINFSKVVS